MAIFSTVLETMINDKFLGYVGPYLFSFTSVSSSSKSLRNIFLSRFLRVLEAAVSRDLKMRDSSCCITPPLYSDSVRVGNFVSVNRGLIVSFLNQQGLMYPNGTSPIFKGLIPLFRSFLPTSTDDQCARRYSHMTPDQREEVESGAPSPYLSSPSSHWTNVSGRGSSDTASSASSWSGSATPPFLATGERLQDHCDHDPVSSDHEDSYGDFRAERSTSSV